MYAWVLIMWIGGGYAGNITVSDIATYDACELLFKNIKAKAPESYYVSGVPFCFQYEKANG